MAAAVMAPALGVPLPLGPPLAVDAGRRQLSSALELGRREMLDGHFEAAIQHFTHALDLKPGLVHALVSRGCCYLSLQGGEEKAQRDFAEVIAKDVGFNRNVYVLIALCFKRSGDYHTAIRYLSRCIAQFPAFKPALMARGELNLKVREYEKARVDFRQVLLVAPRNYTARRGLGDALRGLGDLREAERQYTKAIDEAQAAVARHQNHGFAGMDAHLAMAGDTMDELDESAEDSAMQSQGKPEDEFDAEIVGSTNQAGANAADGFGLLQDEEPLRGLPQLHNFIMEVLLRRALLLRIAGDLEGAGADLLEVLQQDTENGLALFWYGKVLIEQHRHQEAPAFLQASVKHHEETRGPALALLGALLVTQPEPDCESAVRHLREAAKIIPNSHAVRSTQWICAAAAALKEDPHDARRAVGLLDRAFAALTGGGGSSSSTAAPPSTDAAPRSARSVQSLRSSSSGPTSARGVHHPSRTVASTPRVHVAGSGGAAVAGLVSSKEECIWSTARGVVKRRVELAQGDDLDMALNCSTYLQLVAKQPQVQCAQIPPLLYALRAVALSDLGRFEEAILDCRQALSIDPEDEVTQYNMHLVGGILRSRAAEHDAAIGKFTKAVRLRPVITEARVHRAIALASAARSICSAGKSGHGEVGVGRAVHLLADAVQDLQAAEQQAMIADTPPPRGLASLQAACLCGLGRLEEAWEVLQQARGAQEHYGSENDSLVGKSSGNRSALEAEVLMLLGRYQDTIDVCTALLSAEDADKVSAYLMRSRCWGELGDSERAFEDCREALIAAPERAEIHEASGELFLAHGCHHEAITALNTAAKLRGSLPPRLAYLRALAHLSMGNVGAALKDLNRGLRLNPNIQVATRARDGVAALQMLLDGDFRYAHVRLNVLIHSVRAPQSVSSGGSNSSESLPVLFQPYELMLYRGLCSLCLGDVAAAVLDFEASVEMARQLFAIQASKPTAASTSSLGVASVSGGQASGSAAGNKVEANVAKLQRLCPVATEEGLLQFECEMLYNVALCHLICHDYRAASATCELLLEHNAALANAGPHAQCLAWFLLGVCRLALGEARSEAVREAFMHSYAHDPVYVDDFLRRHEPREPTSDAAVGGVGSGAGSGGDRGGVLRRVGAPSRVGGPVAVRAPPPAAGCDAAPEAVCCLRKDRGALGARLPPRKVQVKDVVIWCRASAGWPFVQAPELAPTPTSSAGIACCVSLSRPGFVPDHHEVGVKAALPWET